MIPIADTFYDCESNCTVYSLILLSFWLTKMTLGQKLFPWKVIFTFL